MNWKVEINNQIIEASRQRKISSALKKLVKLLLTGNTRFNLLYSSSRESYTTIIFRENLSIQTSKILLKNGYKNIYLQWKNF